MVNSASGFTLLEVVISLFILAIILLGVDAMQLSALRQSQVNYFFSIAANQLQSFHEELQVLNNADHTTAFNRWNLQNKTLLPNGRGNIKGHYPNYDIAIFWGDNTLQDCTHDRIGKSGCLRETIQV